MPYGVVGGKGLSKKSQTQSQLSVSKGALGQTPSIIATDLADESRVEARKRFRFLNAERFGILFTEPARS
jgi:hypothetical protein